MERLTEKHYLAEDHYMKCSEDCNVDMDCVDCQAFDKLIERLAAYEDIGMTPEEIKAPFTEDTMINLEAQAMGVEPSRLREIAEADKDGRVVVLPCKVGDTVWRIIRDGEPHITRDEVRDMYFADDMTQWYKDYYGIRYSDAYEVYGLKRTGCCGCAISARAAADLELIRPYEPNVVKAAWAIFGDSYRYRAKYNEYKAMRREQEKARMQGTTQAELPGQITWEDVAT